LLLFLYQSYLFSPSHIEIALFVSPQVGVTYLLYFGDMGMLSLAIFLVTGSVGFLASLWFTSLWFTKTIYGSIKVPHSLQTRSPFFRPFPCFL
jgi:transmembrane 9 superfamily protein 2/4